MNLLINGSLCLNGVVMEPPKLEPIPVKREHLIKCEFCGYRNKRSAWFCVNCGARISMATTARAYVEPAVQRFGLLLLLLIPIAIVSIAAFSWIAEGLGLGDQVAPLINKVVLGIGAFGLLVLVPGILILTYKRKSKIK
jgi:hypothetical protein